MDITRITERTAEEIHKNPYDLTVAIFLNNECHKYQFVVNRGPGDNHQPLMETTSSQTTLQGVVEEVRTFFEDVSKLFSNKKFPSYIRTVDSNLIDKITHDLFEKQVACTFQ